MMLSDDGQVILGRLDVYADEELRKNSGSEIAFTIMDVKIPSIFAEGMKHVSYNHMSDMTCETHVIAFKSRVLIHKEDGPAVLITRGDITQYRFVIHGVNVRIEDLPIDDEQKLLLKLKYVNYH